MNFGFFTGRLRSPGLWFVLFLVLYTVGMFRVVLPADAVIQAGDHNYGLMAFYKSELPGSMIDGFWRSFPLLGRVGHMPPTWTLLSLSLLPVDLYMDWIYGINLALASLFLFAFLRLRGLAPFSCAIGALVSFWLGSNLTLVLPGHLEKYAVLLFASASLWALERYLQHPGLRRALFAGASVGLMFLHQADLALFFALPLGAYLLFGLLTRRPARGWSRVAWMALPAALLVWEAYGFAMQTQVRGVEVLERGSPEQKWAFATQWSWPPGESLDLIAPGFWGWLSGHPDAPYHGEMGGSEDWPNLKNESQYIGILPFALALLALVAAPAPRRREVFFWSAAAAITFLLACGKYTPLYALFYKLPLVNAIRNPNKFLQVFQLCLGLLAAFGADALLKTSPRRRKAFALGLALCAIALGLTSLVTDPTDPLQLRRFANGPWAASAASIHQNRRVALVHAALFACAGAALFSLANTRKAALAPPLLAVLLALDGLLLGAHYLQPMDTSFIRNNPVADFLKKDLGPRRVAVVDQSGIYGFYLTHVFPAHNIPFANIAAAPRLQEDYQRYNEALDGRDILRWRDFAVKYVLMSRPLWKQIRATPGIDRILREVMAYKVGPDAHVVLEFLPPAERFSLHSAWIPAKPAEALQALRKGLATPPHIHAVIPAAAHPGPPGEILSASAHSTGFDLHIRVDSPEAFLRLSDKWDPALFARIDGGPETPLLQTDILFAGLVLPRGEHRVELSFRTPSLGRRLQGIGWLIALATFIPFPSLLRKRPTP
jgi:xanthosine utilization system XapX-like protein